MGAVCNPVREGVPHYTGAKESHQGWSTPQVSVHFICFRLFGFLALWRSCINLTFSQVPRAAVEVLYKAGYTVRRGQGGERVLQELAITPWPGR